MTIPEAIELLKTGGPYSALAIVMWVARHLYLARESDKEKHDVEKQALNERIIKIVEGQNQALGTSIQNQQRQNEALTSALDNQRLLIDAVKAVTHRGG